MTKWSPIRSLIIRVIYKSDNREESDLLITSKVVDRIEPINQKYDKM